jgi:hypothetical protein
VCSADETSQTIVRRPWAAAAIPSASATVEALVEELRHRGNLSSYRKTGE